MKSMARSNLSCPGCKCVQTIAAAKDPRQVFSSNMQANAGSGSKFLESVSQQGELQKDPKNMTRAHVVLFTKEDTLEKKQFVTTKTHTHLPALGGRKQRLLEAGHCCARVSATATTGT